MMIGLLAKAFRETWLMTFLFGFGVFCVLGLLTHVLPQIQGSITDVFKEIPIAKSLFSAMLGTELGSEVTAQSMQSFLWVHPVFLALTWGFEMIFCTRIPVGEIDRGTVDLLFGLPVSRRKVFLCETIIWLLSGVWLLSCALAGHWLIAPLLPDVIRPDFSVTLMVLLNFYCVFIAVGGIGFLIASVSNYRSRAVGTFFAIVLISFLLNFLAQFWIPARQIAFLSVMSYYRPAQTILSSEFASSNLLILLGIGAVAWAAAGEIMARRSLCSV